MQVENERLVLILHHLARDFRPVTPPSRASVSPSTRNGTPRASLFHPLSAQKGK